jgi:hypothetical protein
LPRAGIKKSSSEKSSQDDTNVVVTNRRGVRIRICGDDILSNTSFSDEDRQRRAFNNNNVNNGSFDLKSKSSKTILENVENRQDVQTSLNLNSFIEKKEVDISDQFVVASSKKVGKKAKSKRKYTLEELEVEGFEPSTSESERQSNIPEEFDDIEDDDEDVEVDLNSLIEGGVDDDDDNLVVDESLFEAKSKKVSMVLPDMDSSSRRPSRPKLTIVDDLDDEEDDDAFGEDQELVRTNFVSFNQKKCFWFIKKVANSLRLSERNKLAFLKF